MLQTVPSPKQKTLDNSRQTWRQVPFQKLNYIIFKHMKSNKGITTTLANLSQFILQQRINHSHRSVKLLDNITQELHLLRDQLLPSMEILHFLVQKHNYNVRNKLTLASKKADLENTSLNIKFTVNDKTNSVTYLAQFWKMTVAERMAQEVQPQNTAHQLLFLLAQVIKQLSQGQFLNELIRNHEASRKFIIDFQIQIADKDKCSSTSLQHLNHRWTNHARLDSTRQLVLSCYTNTHLTQLLSLNKKSPYLTSSQKASRLKGTSQSTRKDSSQLMDSTQNPRRYKSMDESQPLFEIYDNELDVTILSSDSDQLSGSHIISELNYEDEEEGDFELLIEESNRETKFISENQAFFSEINSLLPTIF